MDQTNQLGDVPNFVAHFTDLSKAARNFLFALGMGSPVISETTGARTISQADNGKIILCSNAAGCVLTFESGGIYSNFACAAVQLGAAQISVVGDGVSVFNRQSNTKSAGQYALISMIVLLTGDVLLVGDTSA